MHFYNDVHALHLFPLFYMVGGGRGWMQRMQLTPLFGQNITFLDEIKAIFLTNVLKIWGKKCTIPPSADS